MHFNNTNQLYLYLEIILAVGLFHLRYTAEREKMRVWLIYIYTERDGVYMFQMKVLQDEHYFLQNNTN